MTSTDLLHSNRSQEPFVRALSSETDELDLIVDGMHCAGCMRKIEKNVLALEGVSKARCNLSTKRVHIEWHHGSQTSHQIIETLSIAGFDAVPFDSKLLATSDDARGKRLLRAMAVAGFAAANVMLFSVSVWSGMASDMDRETIVLFHWISALIAIPAVAYAGQPFFRSAYGALRARSLNMDVPISLAVLLATGMSLIETIRGASHVYFDASVTLLFFLLIGRYLDVRMRAKACATAQNLLSLRSVAAQLIGADGSTHPVMVEDLRPGDDILVPAGARIPIDGDVKVGTSDVDMSLVTGESLPVSVTTGIQVFAGTLNLNGPLTIRVTKVEEESLLAEIVRLMETAEQGRAGYVRLADRIAKIYAPAVHILALTTFVGWLLFGASVHTALMTAIAVLIVTCPCALGLAVPVVQVVASGKLLRQGVLVKSADALEKLADIDEAVFDKTGTLTTGDLVLLNRESLDEKDYRSAVSLARQSSHPLSKALVKAFENLAVIDMSECEEVPGLGLRAAEDGEEIRLGSAEWVERADQMVPAPGPQLWFRRSKSQPVQLLFHDQLRPDAERALKRFRTAGIGTHLLSGDRNTVVRSVTKGLRFDHALGEQKPGEKIEYLEHLAKENKNTLMVGDGLNDAPALKAAHVSMSPATAADISQTAADFVFQGKSLMPVASTFLIAKKARRHILQNFAMAFLYNAIAIPLAMAGVVTPLIAAVAMSSSSILVTANAMRMTWDRSEGRP